jgi:predicted nucleic-acid-binding Zn-ribbon protein
MAVGGYLRGLIRPKVRRTCRDCGYSWIVPRYYTKHHTPLSGPTSSGSKVGSYGTPGAFESRFTGDVIGEAMSIAPANEEWLEAKAQFSQCAKCGSERFRQRRLWSESKAEYEGDD